MQSDGLQLVGAECNEQMRTFAQTILIVEDQSFVRNVTCEVLRAAGYRVLIAGQADEAAQIFEWNARDVDLLLTDVVLPGENGRALAERLKRANPKLKVLLISGYPAQMEPEGVQRCLAKPFSTEGLLRSVRQVLGAEPIHAGCGAAGRDGTGLTLPRPVDLRG